MLHSAQPRTTMAKEKSGHTNKRTTSSPWLSIGLHAIWLPFKGHISNLVINLLYLYSLLSSTLQQMQVVLSYFLYATTSTFYNTVWLGPHVGSLHFPLSFWHYNNQRSGPRICTARYLICIIIFGMLFSFKMTYNKLLFKVQQKSLCHSCSYIICL